MSGGSPRVTGGPVMIVTSSGDESIDLDPVKNEGQLQRKPPPVFAKPTTGSIFLGADLNPLGSMPPPKLNTVKKSRILVNPGKSMVEWMKLQAEGASAPIKLRKIGFQEMALHCTTNDTWMALNGRVYDVSEYCKYHPGGVEEIMKGAGQDGTALFNQVHRWVNIDSILKGRLLGFLVQDMTIKLQASLAQLSPISDQIQILPTTRFLQDDTHLFLEVDSDLNDDSDMDEECWTVGILGRERLLLKVVVKPPELWMAHFKLWQALKEDSIRVTFDNKFRKLQIKLKKPTKEKWKAIGGPLEGNNTILDSRAAIEDMYPAKLIRKDRITYNTFLFVFRIVTSAIIGVPVGFHVKIRLEDEVRKYTPIFPYFDQTVEDKWKANRSLKKDLYFIIKIYPEGKLTRRLADLPISKDSDGHDDFPSNFSVGCPGGAFNLGFLNGVSTLCILAAGSGITPFIRIIQYLVQNRERVGLGKVIFIYFNETPQDIIWNDDWEKLRLEAEDWFYYYPVISKAKDNWTGLQGRVSSELIEKCFKDSNYNESPTNSCSGAKDSYEIVDKVTICGSYGFNDACREAVKTQRLLRIEDPSGIYIFTG